MDRLTVSFIVQKDTHIAINAAGNDTLGRTITGCQCFRIFGLEPNWHLQNLQCSSDRSWLL